MTTLLGLIISDRQGADSSWSSRLSLSSAPSSASLAVTLSERATCVSSILSGAAVDASKINSKVKCDALKDVETEMTCKLNSGLMTR